MSSSSPALFASRRRRSLIGGGTNTVAATAAVTSSPAKKTTTITSPDQQQHLAPPPIVSEARAYQRLKSEHRFERRQPPSHDSSSSAASSSTRHLHLAARHILPIDTTTLSYSEGGASGQAEQVEVDIDTYRRRQHLQDQQQQEVQNALSNDTTLISDMTAGSDLVSPTHHDDHDGSNDASQQQGREEPTSWWLSMFQQLEHRHEAERKAWQDNLAKAETKKTQYKSELRRNIANQLQWLEDRMTSPSHMLPGLRQHDSHSGSGGGSGSDKYSSRHDSATTESNITSSTGPQQQQQQQHQRYGDSHHHSINHDNDVRVAKWKQKAAVLKELVELTEKQHTTEKAEWEQRVVTLEHSLVETRDNYAKQLETAFKHQEYMEGLVQQWKDTADGGIEQQRSLQKQVDRWKETANDALQQQRSLQEQVEQEQQKQVSLQQALLQQQQQQDDRERRNARDEEFDQLQETLNQERKRAEEAERKFRHLQEVVQSKAQEIATLREQVQEIATLREHAETAQTEHQSQVTALTTQCQQIQEDRQQEVEQHAKQVMQLQDKLERAQEEAETFRAQAADFSEAATTARSQCSNLQKSLALSENSNTPMMARMSPVAKHRVEWDDKLDRALAERDLYQQEATALKAERDDLAEQLSLLQSDDFLEQYEQLAEKHAELIERLAAFEHQGEASSSSRNQVEIAEQTIASLREENKKLEDALADEGDRHAQEVRKLQAEMRQVESEAKLLRIKAQQGASLQQENEAESDNLRSKLQQKDEEVNVRCQELSEHFQATIDEMQQRIRDLEHELDNMRNKLKAKDDQLNQLSLELSQENMAAQSGLALRIQELEYELANRPAAALQRLAEMSEQHTRDQRDLMDKLDDAVSAKRSQQQQVQTLSKSLADLKSLHAKALKKYDRMVVDKKELQHELSKVQEELEKSQERYNQDEPSKENARPEVEPTVVVHTDERLISALAELQKDVRDMQQQLIDTAQNQNLEHTFLDRFRTDLTNIQTSLNDAVVELTLEADALLESREAIKAVASDASSLMGERDMSSKTRFLDQQQQLLSEFGELRESMNATAAARSSENYSCLKELINDIRRKEAALSAAQTELRHVKEKLEAEIAARRKAEGEIDNYIEQADAYEEQLMTLQSNNTSLAKKLQVAGLKIDASLNHMPGGDDEANSTFATPRSYAGGSSGGQRQDSLPVLDEALAFAENMANLVRKEEKDGNFLDMLEAMSELMEPKLTTTGNAIPLSPKRSCSTPKGRKTKSFMSFDETASERTLSTAQSSPVSPLKPRHRKLFDETTGSIEIVHEGSMDERDDPRSPRTFERASKLALVVEQLYARCQMLERERSEMMETTLDLLEATKEANAAEIDAALATARRRAVEDILEMHKSSKKDQERVLMRIMMNHNNSCT